MAQNPAWQERHLVFSHRSPFFMGELLFTVKDTFWIDQIGLILAANV